jgi:hypothetical protein
MPPGTFGRFYDVGELAASVLSLSWYGIALMEAAATRGVHGDTATATRMFIEVLDHWGPVGVGPSSGSPAIHNAVAGAARHNHGRTSAMSPGPAAHCFDARDCIRSVRVVGMPL